MNTLWGADESTPDNPAVMRTATMTTNGDVPFEVPESIRRIADDQSRQLAWTFFVYFSRFEYALKRAGYFRKPNGDAYPDWDAFAEAVHGDLNLDETAGLPEAMDYYASCPPKKQVVVGGELRWSSSLPGGRSELERTLRLVRRVRNNLFHGGKFQGRASDPSRDADLLTNALVILQACLPLDDQVRSYFDEPLWD